ncbi:MAG: hypothetical protein LBC68_14080 [Prevotellaceae bacterium]|jgi:hypothetical protein|nr:hypothetical protein [Prevotellaceae bacterium]
MENLLKINKLNKYFQKHPKRLFDIGSVCVVLKAKFHFATSQETCFLFDVARRYAERWENLLNINKYFQKHTRLLFGVAAYVALKTKLRFATSQETCFYLRRSETLRRTVNIRKSAQTRKNLNY